ncbi:KAP family P-loop NTPase fold protein [Psychrobacter alimentarius]|uniref:KAP family P-loop NTPase fold protein n=1 Tax=Psychrobacter alimentarius TaxID=261164 RepID=UPI00191A689E|nr:P-loop NTPase fold protein [Psychrobacter alimentarius]
MELRRHNVEVNDADPFANDWLERKGFAIQLTNIVENNKQGEVVIGLSGQWGEGKTTFVKMWQKHMENKDIASIYFDAFEYDYLEDVFLSLAIEIYNYAKVNGLTAQEDYLNKSKNTYHLLQAMIAKTSPINIDSSLQENLIGNESQPFDIAKIIKDNLNFSLDNAFEQALKQKEVFRDFRKSLSQLATQASNQDIPLVIIIDELDRCKPSFAVEILEKIKHLFLVEDVIFVLSMHHEQLEESIKKVYGQNINAHTYLQKFIDYQTRLPKNKFLLDAIRDKYFYNQVKFLNFPTYNHSSEVFELFALLSNFCELSYRQTNKALQILKVFLNSEDRNFGRNYQKVNLVVFLSVVMVSNDPLVQLIRNGKTSFENVRDHFTEVFTKNNGRVEELEVYLRLSFQKFDYFLNTQDSTELSFYNVFAESIRRESVLQDLLARLESFESY